MQKRKISDACHVMNTGHKINFNNVKILDIEPVRNIRLSSEMLHIHFYDKTLNRMEDTQYLKNDYNIFIDNIKPYL